MIWIEIDNQIVEYTISYSKRKTISLIINKEGMLKVRAPIGVNQDIIDEILQQKKEWIKKSIEQARRKLEVQKELNNIMFLGREYEIIKKPSSKEKTIVEWNQEKGQVYVYEDKISREELGDLLEKNLKTQAKSIIKDRVEYYKSKIGVEYNQIFIKNQKTRWGSCSSKRNLNFNYRIVMTPLEILDYVVVHELCHLIHFNHSKEFWDLVELILPDYNERRMWLKEWKYSL